MRRTRISLLLVLGMLAALLPMGAVAPALAADDHVMLTEIVVTPNEGEFIEIHNPTAAAVDLSNYYLTDATFAGGNTYYYNIVTGTNAGGGGFNDFHAQFPDGASIGAGEYQTVSIAGSIDFLAAYGITPTYELFEDDASPDAVADMREATSGSIDAASGLSNGGEFLVLYAWNGTSDLVTDIDYAVWGDKAEAVDKTGVAIDGPDGDAEASAYLPDTAIGSQDVISTGAHLFGEAFRRADLNEGTETGAGGNGINGDDETSENTSVTWETAAPSPGASEPPPELADVVINEVDADQVSTDSAEFIELYDGGIGSVALDGLSVVLFNGSDDLSYTPAFDLDGYTTDADGYFVIGSVPGADIDVAPGGSGWLQNGADAVAVVAGDAADYPDDSALPAVGVVDAIVYDTNDPDDAGLLALLNPGQPQVNEGGGGDSTADSNQRCPNGSGGALDTDTYTQAAPNPRAPSNCAPPELADVVINEVDADTPSFDTLEFVELYDGGVGDEALDGLSVVLFNGSNDLAYSVFDLGGYSTDADGYFVIGSVPGADIDVAPGSSGWLQNGADAVAVYAGDFANGSAVSTTDLVDAIVYDTNDSDDAGLLALLNSGQPQVNEDGGGDKDNHSNQRCPNGSGAARDTDTYTQFVPTPGSTNCEIPPVIPDLIINEIIQNPDAVTDANGEWFEIYNAGSADVDINGWTISDNDSDSHLISNGGPLVVPAGGYLVLGNNADSGTNGGAAVDYSYGGSWYLANSADEVVLTDTASNEIDRVEYDGGPAFPDPTGASMALDDPANDNNDGANWCTSSTPFGDGDFGTPGAANDCAAPPVEACGDPATPVHAVQGPGFVSPIVGQVVTVEAVVVGDFQEGNQLNGFFVQEENADFDGDTSTSEGVFIDEGSTNGPDVNAGDLVRATGTVVENFEHTEIAAVNVLVCDYAPGAYGPVSVTLPEATDGDLEKVEGMNVDLINTMSVAQNYFVGRYGQLTLSSDLTNRLFQPTNQVLPNTPESAELADYNNRQLLFLDDGVDVSSCGDNPVPVPYLGAAPPSVLRGGDHVDDLTGVLDYGKINSGGPCWDPTSFGRDYRLHPTQAPVFSTQNPRTAAPDDVGGSVKLVSFNVLNFFNGDGVGGGFPTSRGADTFNEFVRQRIKIYEAMKAIDGDVVGVMEIENDGFDQHSAIAELAKVLNEGPCWNSPAECAALGYADSGLGAGTYAYIDAGPGAIGTDAIAVGFIYKPASVTPVGEPLVVDDPAFVDPRNTGSDRNRPAIAQTFRANSDGALFTPIVNHLKSKGSSCGPGDDDPEQASCNVTRTLAAQYLVDTVVPAVQVASGDLDVAVIGDLNAYAMEDPIQALVSGGFADLVKVFAGDYAYSYTFDGLVGYLDHSLANNNLSEQVTGVTAWHINTDEPAVIDYNEDFNPPGYYGPEPYRASDHDPIVVGLNLTVTPKQAKNHSIGVLSELLPTGNRHYDKRITKAIESIEDSLNPAYWVDDFHLTDKGNKVFDEEKKAVKDLMRVHGSIKPEVDAVIATLVRIDEELASIAIAEATAAGGNEWYLSRAERELQRAQYDLDRGRPDKAIDHYKRAWVYAGKSLTGHGWHCGR